MEAADQAGRESINAENESVEAVLSEIDAHLITVAPVLITGRMPIGYAEIAKVNTAVRTIVRKTEFLVAAIRAAQPHLDASGLEAVENAINPAPPTEEPQS
jgi:hypothetical protein